MAIIGMPILLYKEYQNELVDKIARIDGLTRGALVCLEELGLLGGYCQLWNMEQSILSTDLTALPALEIHGYKVISIPANFRCAVASDVKLAMVAVLFQNSQSEAPLHTHTMNSVSPLIPFMHNEIIFLQFSVGFAALVVGKMELLVMGFGGRHDWIEEDGGAPYLVLR
ncbi:hypothetical protein ACLOJK_031818 [Asimina triloba]